ncbi:MAG TPA: hypothetical protein VFN11_05710 [Ktedonobacterales bacterium]|nr:hypothetical protein [Ktedonobacterales bacterium]
MVAASKRRRGGVARAREQFDLSPVFRRARDYCDRAYSEWYVLSTVYLLAQPNQVIGADEPALRVMNPAKRAAWAEAIAQQLRQRVARSAEPITFIVYASQQYAESLMRAAPDLTFESPLTGKTFVERLHWYDDRLRIRPRMLTVGAPI